MKTIIAGGRNQELTPDMEGKLDDIKDQITLVISGHATGIDTEGENWAARNDVPYTIFPANWNRYGRKAGFIRNTLMADNADAVVLFPGGKGTQMMYEIALEKGLKISDYR